MKIHSVFGKKGFANAGKHYKRSRGKTKNKKNKKDD